MIVYGDPQFDCAYLAIIDALSERVAQTNSDDLDDLRTLLIQVGQLEQAVCDLAQLREERRIAVCDLTDKAALTFYSAYSRMNPSLPARSECSKTLLQRLIEQLRELGKFGDERLIIKVPEGFEFYALYPEQYCCAARDFLHTVSQSARSRQSALIVGIRSIGTTLSALVKIALEGAGWVVERITVRPTGHPYDRQAQLEALGSRRFDWGIVVDEGPGISGSSMASVARGLSTAGINRVAFFPGHNGSPGAGASTEVRQIWKATPRFFTPLDLVSWNGATLHNALLRDSQANCDGVQDLDDISGGLWRKYAFSNEQQWPPACIPLERMKFLAGSKPGHWLLWKFQGFGSLQEENPSAKRNSPLSVTPLSSRFGFVAEPWIEGKRLTAEDAEDERTLESICDYIVSCCSEPLQSEEQRRGIHRLGEMLYWNTKEALGDAHADSARAALALVEGLPSWPPYRDGRMAPWEWIQDSAGRIWKTDCTGHDSDHTMIGKQAILWDIAGTIVEWNLRPATRHNFLIFLHKRGIEIESQHLKFFQLAYTAFRMGQCSLCAMVCGPDSAEGSRLQSAADRYRSMLKGHTLTASDEQNRVATDVRRWSR